MTASGSSAVGVHTRRVIFIDLARALAVVLMVSGHTSSALLSNAYRAGAWVDVWAFQRGLTSGLFLLLAGFAFSVATARYWPAHTRVSEAVGSHRHDRDHRRPANDRARVAVERPETLPASGGKARVGRGRGSGWWGFSSRIF